MSHLALYREWRPKVFDEVVEQKHAVYALRQSVISGQIAHAYLFSGTRGTGKTTLAKRLEEIGVAAVMPLGSPIGSNQGIKTEAMLRIIIEQANIPVVVDAGLGLPSHAAAAIEMGADAVLVNTAVAAAGDPGRMAKAFAMAVEAAFLAREAGPASSSTRAAATSPLNTFDNVI